ncbi:MAG: hypothetical protein IPH85_06185 [Ignavibacteria bacterium]|nr:hypothetical protein [Ignavibacteria bacterium]MBK7185509.1 hypothetical protein [Ignavibacteria bacterium]
MVGAADVDGILWQLSIDNGLTFSKPRPGVGMYGPLSFWGKTITSCFMWASGYQSVPKKTVMVLPLTSPITSALADRVVIPRDRKSVYIAHQNTSGITIIDLATWARRSVHFPNVRRVLAISRDGRYVAIEDISRTRIAEVYEVEAPQTPVYAIPSTLGAMEHYALIGDSKELVFSFSRSLKRLDSSGSKIVVERVFDQVIRQLHPTPDSTKILVVTDDSISLVETETLESNWSVSSSILIERPQFSGDETLFSCKTYVGQCDIRDFESGRLVRRLPGYWSQLSVFRDADNEVGLIPPLFVRTDHSRGMRSHSLGKVEKSKDDRILSSRWDIANDSVLIATPSALYYINVGREPWHLSGETAGPFTLRGESAPDRPLVASLGSVSTKIGVDTSFRYTLTIARPEDIPVSKVIELELEWDAKLALPIPPTPIGASVQGFRRVRIPINVKPGARTYVGDVFVATALGPQLSSAVVATAVFVNNAKYDVVSQNGRISVSDTCLKYPKSSSFFEGLLRYAITWRGSELGVTSLDGSVIDDVRVSDLSGVFVPMTIDQIDKGSGRFTYVLPDVASGVYFVSIYANGQWVTSLYNRTRE